MSRAVMQQALAYIEEVDYGPYDKWPVILALKQALAEPDYWQEEARRYAGNADYWRERYKALAEPEHEHNCYGDGNVYRGVRSKDSSVTTYFVRGDLAEPEHEPVAWMADDGTLLSDVTNPKMYTPLYTAPTPRKPLTDEEIQLIWAKTFEMGSSANTFARAIERAHGIGEQT